MGLFDFLKSNKNIITDNGTNYIYENDGKGKLKEKFIKFNGVLHGEYLKYDESGKILSTDYYHDGQIITLDEKQRIDDNKRRIENNEKEKTLIEYKRNICKLIEIDKTIFDVAYGNLIVQMTNATLLDFSRELSNLFIDYFEEELIKTYLFYKRNYLIHKLIYFKDDEINLNQIFTEYLNSEKIDIDKEIRKIGVIEPRDYYRGTRVATRNVELQNERIISNVFLELKRINYNHNISTLITSLSLNSFNPIELVLITNQDCELIGLEIDGYIKINNTIKSIRDELNNNVWLYYDDKETRVIENKIYQNILSICQQYKFYQGEILFNLENLKVQNLIELSEINNLSAIELYERAKTKHYELKDYSGAMDDFNKSIELNPNFSKAFFNRGILKKVLEDYHGALEDYNKAIELDADSEAYRYRAGIKCALNDFVGAMYDYNFAIEKHPNQKWINYFKRGCLKIELEDYKGAIHDFDMSIDSTNNSNKRWPRSDFYKKRGDCKLKIEDYKGAIEDLKKAIELDPDNEQAIQLLESLK